MCILDKYPNESQRHGDMAKNQHWKNKANLRDLKAATGLVIVLKLDSNRRFFSPCDLEIWWMTTKSNNIPLLYYVKFVLIRTLALQYRNTFWVKISVKLFTWFPSHVLFQTGVIVRKRSIRVKIGDFLSRVTLKFDGVTLKTIGHLFYANSSFVHHLIVIGDWSLSYSSETPNSAQYRRILSCATLKFDRWPCKTIWHLS